MSEQDIDPALFHEGCDLAELIADRDPCLLSLAVALGILLARVSESISKSENPDSLHESFCEIMNDSAAVWHATQSAPLETIIEAMAT